MATTITEVKKLAQDFLRIADKLHADVSAYLDGDESRRAANAYRKVIDANWKFNRAYADYYGEPMSKPMLDYEIAESFI